MMVRLLYRPLGIGVSVAGGVLAGALFRRAWRLLANEDEAPKATEEDRTWTEVLMAAALQGAIFAVVKAVFDRASAKGVRRLTGTWPAG